jgi:hypothetical protein
MSECEVMTDELLLATRQFNFVVLRNREDYREAVHKAECLKLLEEIQRIILSLNERFAGVWQLSYHDSTVRLFQRDPGSTFVSMTFSDRMTGTIKVDYNVQSDNESEVFVLNVSEEEIFFWMCENGSELTPSALANHCLVKTLKKAEGIVRSYVQEEEQRLRKRLA